MNRVLKFVKTFFAVLLALAGLTVFGFLLMFWIALAWIAYQPLPPIPRAEVLYSIREVGSVGDETKIGIYEYDPLGWGIHLTNTAKMAILSDAARKKENDRQKTINIAAAKQMGIIQDVFGDGVLATTSNGGRLVRVAQGLQLQLWKYGKFSTPVSRTVSGYSWDTFCGRSERKLNVRDEIIGNEMIATGCATSGGTSSPHGRHFPTIWRQDTRRTEDLNSRIDPASGWYLTEAVDINERGQILCLAIRANAKDAEHYDRKDGHWVILTPLK